jgi:epoxyqueuosine reductase
MDTQAELMRFLTAHGASLAGVADITSLPGEIRDDLPRAVAFAVALNPAILATITEGPTKEYYAEYRRVNDLLGALSQKTAAWLRGEGFQAVDSPATVKALDINKLCTPLPHKTAAHLAGLGWIGKSALLVTREFGSGVRLNRVLTDAPLSAAQPDLRSRCGACSACVEACPGTAPNGKGWESGQPREHYFDAVKCQTTARRLALARTGVEAAFCGICIAACPWTKQYIRQRLGAKSDTR